MHGDTREEVCSQDYQLVFYSASIDLVDRPFRPRYPARPGSAFREQIVRVSWNSGAIKAVLSVLRCEAPYKENRIYIAVINPAALQRERLGIRCWSNAGSPPSLPWLHGILKGSTGTNGIFLLPVLRRGDRTILPTGSDIGYFPYVLPTRIIVRKRLTNLKKDNAISRPWNLIAPGGAHYESSRGFVRFATQNSSRT